MPAKSGQDAGVFGEIEPPTFGKLAIHSGEGWPVEIFLTKTVDDDGEKSEGQQQQIGFNRFEGFNGNQKDEKEREIFHAAQPMKKSFGNVFGEQGNGLDDKNGDNHGNKAHNQIDQKDFDGKNRRQSDLFSH